MGQLFGFIYAYFLFISNLSYSKVKILIYQTISFLFKGFHYLLLGGVSGAFTSFVSMVRNLLFVWVGSSRFLTFLFIAIYCFIGIFTFSGIVSLLPIVATVFYSLVINFRVKYLKVGLLVVSFLWLIYNIFMVSYGGIIIQVVMIFSNVYSLIRLDKNK